MDNITLKKSNIVGRKPLAVPFDILPLYKRAEQNDLDAVFDLSRHFFSFEVETDHLQAALYYKSLLVENFPSDYDPYTCVVTMTDIAHIFGLLEKPEKAKEWFVRTYKYVFENYPDENRRAVLEEIGYFISLEAFALELREIILN